MAFYWAGLSIILTTAFAMTASAQTPSAKNCPSLYIKRDSAQAFVAKIGLALGHSGKFRFFRRGVELPLTEQTLQPGKSYTTLVFEGKILIGEDYGNGEFGESDFAGAHTKLTAAVASDFNEKYYLGGSIRLNKDSIDISGYHHKHDSQPTAELIANVFRQTLPDVALRITGGRLSTLESQ